MYSKDMLYPVYQFNEIERYLAHTTTVVEGEVLKEKLTDHLDKTYQYFLFLWEEKNLEGILESFLKKFCLEEHNKELFTELFLNAIYLHDIGKMNVNFQWLKMGNEYFRHKADRQQSLTEHSFLSAMFYLNHYIPQIKEKYAPKSEERVIMQGIAYYNAYAISRHHSSYSEFSTFLRKTGAFFDEPYFSLMNLENKPSVTSKESQNITRYLVGKKELSPEIGYIYTRFVYSCLCTSDYYATSDFMQQRTIKDLGVIKDRDSFIDSYRNSDLYKTIKQSPQYSLKDIANANDINVLRTALFQETERKLQELQDSPVYFLEAPTGSGKTNMSINLACKLLERDIRLNRVFYIFPFNTLTEQTEDTLKKYFEEDQMAVLNSITPYKVKGKNEEDEVKDYEQIVLDRQFIHYPLVITTHVNFFAYLFGTHKENIFSLTHLANSVIIIDEVQSYRNSIWSYMIRFLKEYAELLNLKIIIMSATLPGLDAFLEEKIPSLVENPEIYYQSPLFKERVQLDFSMIQPNFPPASGEERDEYIEKLLEKVIEVSEETKGKILVEFIKKKSAYAFYHKLKVYYGESKKVLLITSDDSKSMRKKLIKEHIEPEEAFDVILVATQVVEAGVDIDMDYGFKNLSSIDNEEQFLGRINRSAKKKGSKAYFFNLDNPLQIYRKDKRIDSDLLLTVSNKAGREWLSDKRFQCFYSEVIKAIDEERKRQNEANEEEFRTDKIKGLDFPCVQEKMRLIEEQVDTVRVFLNNSHSGTDLNGGKIWQSYKDIIFDHGLSFAERKYRLSEVASFMDEFMYQIRVWRVEITGVPFSYNDRLFVDAQERYTPEAIYYIEDGDKYFKDGKFSSDLLLGTNSAADMPEFI